MGQVEHRVCAKSVSRRHTKVLKTTSNAARSQQCGSQSHEVWKTLSPRRVGPRWVVRADTPMVVSSLADPVVCQPQHQGLRGRGRCSSPRTRSRPTGFVSFDSGVLRPSLTFHSLVWPRSSPCSLNILWTWDCDPVSRIALGLICMSLAGRLMQRWFSLLILWGPPDDIGGTGGRMERRMRNACFPRTQARGPHSFSARWRSSADPSRHWVVH